MAKQYYIDENGNPIQVSGTVNTAELLPISGNDPTDTKTYIDNKFAETTPTITGNTTNTTSLGIDCYTYGKIVYARVYTVVPRVSLSGEEEIATGFPKPISSDVRVTLTDRKTGLSYRAIINSSGALKNWYNDNPIPTTAELFTTIVYIKE